MLNMKCIVTLYLYVWFCGCLICLDSRLWMLSSLFPKFWFNQFERICVRVLRCMWGLAYIIKLYDGSILNRQHFKKKNFIMNDRKRKKSLKYIFLLFSKSLAGSYDKNIICSSVSFFLSFLAGKRICNTRKKYLFIHVLSLSIYDNIKKCLGKILWLTIRLLSSHCRELHFLRVILTLT